MTAARTHSGALTLALLCSLCLALATAARAGADPSTPTIAAPAAGSSTNSPTPTFSGSTSDLEDAVTLELFAGENTEGLPLQTVPAVLDMLTGEWVAAGIVAIEPGTYTAVALQSPEGQPPMLSSAVTFTVDLAAPLVTIVQPPPFSDNSTPSLEGTAGTEPGDGASVAISIHKGSTVAGALLSEGTALVGGGSWSYMAGHLKDGIYTAVASQRDGAGNVGHSAAVTFVLDTVAPAVSVTAPSFGAVLAGSQPAFAGTAGEAPGDLSEVSLRIYADGPGRTETLVGTLPGLPVGSGGWSAGGEAPHLHDGLYTVDAEQRDTAGNVGGSEPVTFTVETHAPDVAVDLPGIARPGKGRFTGADPSFSGAAASGPEDVAEVMVDLYAGSTPSGLPLREVHAAVEGGRWTTAPVAALPDGLYTVQAEQSDFAETGFSASATFTVDRDPPIPALTAPAPAASEGEGASSERIVGGAGSAPGDAPAVTVELFGGTGPGATATAAEQTVTVPVTAAGFAATFGGLSTGSYTVLARQSDDVGNTGTSSPVTFRLTPLAPPAAPAPSASFQWFPATPHVGEAISLVSTSTASGAPLAALSWGLDGAPAAAGSAVQAVSFATPGGHSVRLTVTDSSGASSAAEQTIQVLPQSMSVMQPFPVVRIAGAESHTGARLSLLSVQAPVGAKIVVSCHGSGCPTRLLSTIAGASTRRPVTGTVVIGFRRFQRTLRVGVTLEIRVSRAGQIGKFTRFSIRRGRLPVRFDSCLDPLGKKPIVCPSS